MMNMGVRLGLVIAVAIAAVSLFLMVSQKHKDPLKPTVNSGQHTSLSETNRPEATDIELIPSDPPGTTIENLVRESGLRGGNPEPILEIIEKFYAKSTDTSIETLEQRFLWSYLYAKLGGDRELYYQAELDLDEAGVGTSRQIELIAATSDELLEIIQTAKIETNTDVEVPSFFMSPRRLEEFAVANRWFQENGAPYAVEIVDDPIPFRRGQQISPYIDFDEPVLVEMAEYDIDAERTLTYVLLKNKEYERAEPYLIRSFLRGSNIAPSAISEIAFDQAKQATRDKGDKKEVAKHLVKAMTWQRIYEKLHFDGKHVLTDLSRYEEYLGREDLIRVAELAEEASLRLDKKLDSQRLALGLQKVESTMPEILKIRTEFQPGPVQ